MQDNQDEETEELEKGYKEEEIIDYGEMWEDRAADIDGDIQGNGTSDLPPNNVVPTAEDLEEESLSRKAHAVIICFLTILLKWFCRYNIGNNAIDTVLHFYCFILKQFSPLLASISFIFPKSLRSLEYILRVNRNSRIKFVVCPKINSIYN